MPITRLPFCRFADAQFIARRKKEAPYDFGIDLGGSAGAHWFRAEQWIRGDVQRRDPGIHHVRLSVHQIFVFTQG